MGKRRNASQTRKTKERSPNRLNKSRRYAEGSARPCPRLIHTPAQHDGYEHTNEVTGKTSASKTKERKRRGLAGELGLTAQRVSILDRRLLVEKIVDLSGQLALHGGYHVGVHVQRQLDRAMA